MTSGTFALSTPAAAPAVRDQSRIVEFLLVGGATLALFPLAWILRRTLGLNASEFGVGFVTFYGAYVINDPHFAVTYLLFYKNAKSRAFGSEWSRAYRARYLVAGVVVPALLAVWAIGALALRSAQSIGWMVQLMFLLVGWHYAKQGFGVLAVLSARRGAPLAASERRVFLAHAFAGWAFAWANPAAPAGEFEEKGVVYTALAHPRWLELATGTALALSTVALGWTLATKWGRERRTLPGAPLAGFLITVWSWTIYSSADRLVQYMIPALHSIQYLYFVWLAKRNEARAFEGPPSFGRPVAVRLGLLALSALGLGWFLFRGAPTFLDDVLVPRAGHARLGATPFFATFFVFVNIHHYFMDNVVWRRDGPDARYLRDAVAPG